jgi:hypothetical protein
MLVTDIGYALAGLTAVGIIFIGARFLLVLRSNGPKATVYGVHGATAVVLLATAALLFT